MSTVELLRADVSKYRPEVYKSEKSKILKKTSQSSNRSAIIYFHPIIVLDVRGGKKFKSRFRNQINCNANNK